MILVSFDIDGTLEVGDPPGPVTFEMVHRARELGYVIGSASDRTRRDQQQLWANNTSRSTSSATSHLHEIRAQFECSATTTSRHDRRRAVRKAAGSSSHWSITYRPWRVAGWIL